MCHVCVIYEGPGGVAGFLFMMHVQHLDQVVQKSVWRLYSKVETHHFKQHILKVDDCVPPFPEVPCLFVDNLVGVLESDSNAGDDELFQLARVFFDFGRDEQGNGCNLLFSEIRKETGTGLSLCLRSDAEERIQFS